MAAKVLDDGEPLQVGEVKTENVTEVSEDNEVAKATLHKDTQKIYIQI